ncbi:MAG: C25 family cysteine peptidase [Rubripirellula sp.]
MTFSRIIFGLTILIGCAAIETDHAVAVDAVVVCPEVFRDELQPWLDHRRQEGLSVVVVDSAERPSDVRNLIRGAADDATRYVVLVGDAPVIGTPCDPSRRIPIDYQPTTVTAKWGSTPTLSSDLLYGDFDGDGLPEAVVGRMPVDTTDELRRAVNRIIAYENSIDFGEWRTEVQLVGGVGGFGMMADAAIESVTRTVVTSVLPMATRTRVAYASAGHPFCPIGASFTDCVLNNYQRGARFWVYAGHGQVTELDRFPQTEAGIPVLDRNSAKRLSRPDGASPIAILLACYTGAMDAPEDSIAEEMWLTDGGPVAVVAGSRVTMPYGNTTAAVGLIDGVFSKQLPRLGDAWLSALGEMHREDEPQTVDANANSRMMIDALATMISPAGTVLMDERREHMLLYNLIGDPMLSMQHPQPMTMTVAASHALGDVVEVVSTSPVTGQLCVSIDRPLGAAIDGDPNETTVAELSMETTANQPTITKFRLPVGISGPLIIRGFVAGQKEWATGAARTILRAP